MIKNILLGALALCLAVPAFGATTYGTGITLQDSTALGDLHENGETHEGSRVRLEGRVVAIVPDGTWLRVEDPDGVGFWVQAGDWTFGEDALGLYGVAEGDIGRVVPENVDSLDGLSENLGSGETHGLVAVGAIVGEVEAIVLDGVQAGGVVPVVPPGSQGEGTGEGSPDEGESTQGNG